MEANELGHPPGDGPFKLFVYGTLKSGQCRGEVMSGEEFLGTARTTRDFVFLTNGSYPALCRPRDGEEAQHVRGELYLCRRETLPRLDRIEGAPYLYRLEEISLEGVEGPVYTYVYNDARRGTERPGRELAQVGGEEWTS